MISKSYSLQKVTINEKDWIKQLWSSKRKKLISMFNSRQFDIKYVHKKNVENQVIIRRQK